MNSCTYRAARIIKALGRLSRNARSNDGVVLRSDDVPALAQHRRPVERLENLASLQTVPVFD